jgi:thiosulfate reductase/polysulfide reductase chain A
MLVYRMPFERMTQSQNDPVFREFWPENAAVMNRVKAEEMGIADGDEVYVESIAGKIKLKAKLIMGIRPDCVAIDHGFGHWSPGLTVAAGKGANDGDLVPAMTIAEQLELNTPGMAALMEDVALKVTKA